jgi:hypothetical protein
MVLVIHIYIAKTIIEKELCTNVSESIVYSQDVDSFFAVFGSALECRFGLSMDEPRLQGAFTIKIARYVILPCIGASSLSPFAPFYSSWISEVVSYLLYTSHSIKRIHN